MEGFLPETDPVSVILSEAKNRSLQREILRFAQNDRQSGLGFSKTLLM
jgi:hypothetical protein